MRRASRIILLGLCLALAGNSSDGASPNLATAFVEITDDGAGYAGDQQATEGITQPPRSSGSTIPAPTPTAPGAGPAAPASAARSGTMAGAAQPNPTVQPAATGPAGSTRFPCCRRSSTGASHRAASRRRVAVRAIGPRESGTG